MCRANIEAMGDARHSTMSVARPRRAAHVYHIRSLEGQGKVEDSELLELKAELGALLRRRIHSPRVTCGGTNL